MIAYVTQTGGISKTGEARGHSDACLLDLWVIIDDAPIEEIAARVSLPEFDPASVSDY